MGSPTIKDEGTRRILQQNVRQILGAMQMSENHLHRRSKVSQKHVNNITNARTGAGVDTLGYIAQAMGVPAWFLMLPGAGAAFEDARRIVTITEKATHAEPEDRNALYQITKKFAL